jgi:hypothetical protein
LGGFMPERIEGVSAPAGGRSRSVEDRPTPEALVGLAYPPRPMLVARCPGAGAGDEVLIGGTFCSTVPQFWLVLNRSYAGLTDECFLEAEDVGRTGEAAGGAWAPASGRSGR